MCDFFLEWKIERERLENSWSLQRGELNCLQKKSQRFFLRMRSGGWSKLFELVEAEELILGKKIGFNFCIPIAFQQLVFPFVNISPFSPYLASPLSPG